MSAPRQAIEALHRSYIALTGQSVSLDMARERQWFDWRKRGFAMEDLILVVKTIRAGIKTGKRYPGALKFSNLIGMPDRFEEDLALAKSAQNAAAPRRQMPAKLRPDGRQMPATAAGLRTEQSAKEASDRAISGLRQFRERNK